METIGWEHVVLGIISKIISKSYIQSILGVWLSSFNSTANPFVYALLMPAYRKCVRQTYCPCATGSKRLTTQESANTISSIVSNKDDVIETDICQ